MGGLRTPRRRQVVINTSRLPKVSTSPVMAACCLLVLAPSDSRLIELLQKLKEPSRDRLLKVVFCTQVLPDRDLQLGQSSIGSDRSICV